MTIHPENFKTSKSIAHSEIIGRWENICAEAEALALDMPVELTAIFADIKTDKLAEETPALLREAKGYLISLAKDVMGDNSYSVFTAAVRKRIEASGGKIQSSFMLRTWGEEFGDQPKSAEVAKLAGNVSFLNSVCDMAEENALDITGKANGRTK